MSSALLRQALALVDPEENLKTKRRARRSPYQQQEARGQGIGYQKHRSRKTDKKPSKSKEHLVEENIKKLLALSQLTADAALSDKLIERALTGKPLADKIEVKTEEEKSILFPEETFKDFEKELFCN